MIISDTKKCFEKIKVSKYEEEWLGQGEQLYLESGMITLENDIWVETWVTKRKLSCKNLGAENLSRRVVKGTDTNWEYV